MRRDAVNPWLIPDKFAGLEVQLKTSESHSFKDVNGQSTSLRRASVMHRIAPGLRLASESLTFALFNKIIQNNKKIIWRCIVCERAKNQIHWERFRKRKRFARYQTTSTVATQVKTTKLRQTSCLPSANLAKSPAAEFRAAKQHDRQTR